MQLDKSMPTIDVRTMEIKPAICLDFDGTIRRSASGRKFIADLDDIELFPDVEARLWDFRERGFLIFGVTNQGGVAFGIKHPNEEMKEIDRTLALFERNPFHIVKSCWHHENGKVHPFNHRSLFRKPDIGMLAICEFEAFNAGYVVDWDNSVFVGDRDEDKECAKRAGTGFQWAWDFFGREKPEAGS